jgi:hypothetical protein
MLNFDPEYHRAASSLTEEDDPEQWKNIFS